MKRFILFDIFDIKMMNSVFLITNIQEVSYQTLFLIPPNPSIQIIFAIQQTNRRFVVLSINALLR